LPEEQQRRADCQSSIVLPEGAGLTARNRGRPTSRNHVVRRRIFQLIEIVVPVCRDLKPSARRVPESTTEGKCKRGAEGVRIVLDRAAAAGDAGTQVYHRNDIVKSFLAGEVDRQIGVEKVDGDVVRPQLSRRPDFRWIDRHALGVDVSPASGEKRRAADVDLVPQAEHRSVLGHDPDRILSGVIATIESGELLRVLQVAIGTVLGQVTDLRLGGSRHAQQRQRAQKTHH